MAWTDHPFATTCFVQLVATIAYEVRQRETSFGRFLHSFFVMPFWATFLVFGVCWLWRTVSRSKSLELYRALSVRQRFQPRGAFDPRQPSNDVESFPITPLSADVTSQTRRAPWQEETTQSRR